VPLHFGKDIPARPRKAKSLYAREREKERKRERARTREREREKQYSTRLHGRLSSALIATCEHVLLKQRGSSVRQRERETETERERQREKEKEGRLGYLPARLMSALSSWRRSVRLLLVGYE
jgi:hypothetical protein